MVTRQKFYQSIVFQHLCLIVKQLANMKILLVFLPTQWKAVLEGKTWIVESTTQNFTGKIYESEIGFTSFLLKRTAAVTVLVVVTK